MVIQPHRNGCPQMVYQNVQQRPDAFSDLNGQSSDCLPRAGVPSFSAPWGRRTEGRPVCFCRQIASPDSRCHSNQMLSVPVEKTVTHYDTTIAGWCKYGFAGEMLRMWKQCSQFLGKAPKDGRRRRMGFSFTFWGKAIIMVDIHKRNRRSQYDFYGNVASGPG